MTCARYVEPDAAERYVLGQMTEAEQSVFEEHYFACDDCFETVRALQDLQTVLRTSPSPHASKDEAIGRAVPSVDRAEKPETRTSAAPVVSIATRARKSKVTPSIFWGLAVAASLLTAVVVWQRRPAPPQPPTTVARNEPATPGVEPPATSGTSKTPTTPGSTTPSPSTEQTPPPARRPLDLTALALVIPPPYVPLQTRGAETSPHADAFRTAMASYNAKDYAAATAALRALADANPSDGRTQFFLGVSALMTEDVATATTALDRAAASGVAPFASEAHFYLAKAALREKDLARAERELTLSVEQEAGPADEASRLLRAVRQARRE
jgi:cytoskeletal protein RodZ